MAWYWWVLIILGVCAGYVAIGWVIYFFIRDKFGQSLCDVVCNWPIYLAGLIIFWFADF